MLFFNVPSKSFLSLRGMKGLVSSGEYSNLAAREKDFQELMNRKKRVLISSYTFSSQNKGVLQKKRKRSSLRFRH